MSDQRMISGRVSVAERPKPEDLRRELESLIVADLLGPAGGEDETLPGGERVRDRYLLGMLAPTGTVAAGPERQDDPGSDSDDPVKPRLLDGGRMVGAYVDSGGRPVSWNLTREGGAGSARQ